MSLPCALFVVRDHRDAIIRSWLRPITAAARDAQESEAATLLRSLSAEHPDISIAGFCYGAEGLRLTVSDIIDALGASERGRASVVYRRLTRAAGEVAKSRPAFSFRPGKSSNIQWFKEAREVPRRHQHSYAPFTYVYRDARDGALNQMTAFLPSADPKPALAALIASESWWEPVALLEGTARADFTHSPSDEGLIEPVLDESGAPMRRLYQLDPPPEGEGDDGKPGAEAAPQIPPAQKRPAPSPQMVADKLAEILMRFAIERAVALGHIPPAMREGGVDPLEVFRNYLLTKRPLIVIETVHYEIAANIGKVVAAIAGLRPKTERRAGGDIIAAPERQARVVLFEKSTFERTFNDGEKELDNRLRMLAQQGDIGVVVADSMTALPAAIRLNRDLELRLPDISGPVRGAVLTALFGRDAVSTPQDDTWSRYATMLDFEKVAFAGITGRQAVEDLAERVRGRLTRMGASKGVRLADIHGLGAAKQQAETFIADMTAYLSGRIPWSELDRGMLLVGPPGTGKTMLAKAMSKESGIRFIHASAAEWQATSHLGEHIQAIRNSFSMARRFAPAILFVDEFDSIGRRGHGGQNEFYHTAVVNCVLEELQGFEDREGVVVVAATNRVESVDPALRRAGRLDRVVEVHYPTVDALEKIYGYYIGEQKKIGLEHGPLNLRELARLTFGQTGADVELYVRGAARRARGRAANGHPAVITQADFAAEIMKSPVGESGAIRLSEEEMKRVAVHESGHALIKLTGPDKGDTISFLSIAPRADGTLGFVYSGPDERHTRTREELCEIVRVLFGGRAAESIVYGEWEVSSGSGGPSPYADLAQATRLVTAMATQYGYSKKGGLFWRQKDTLPGALEEEIAAELDRLYKETKLRVQRNKKVLDRITALLLERQEITGEELREILKRR